MAEIRLKKNWSGYPPGRIVTVSVERAEYLVDELKVASYTQEQLALNEVAKDEKSKDGSDQEESKTSDDSKDEKSKDGSKGKGK